MKLNEINEIVETDFHYLSTRRRRSPFAFPFFMMVPKEDEKNGKLKEKLTARKVLREAKIKHKSTRQIIFRD